MVIETKTKMTFPQIGPKNKLSIPGAAAAASGAAGAHAPSVVVKASRDQRSLAPHRGELEVVGDIIDLGAPRLRCAAARSPSTTRRLHSYTPNPRLYPGPAKSEPKTKRAEGRDRRRKRVYKQAVPNARLYRAQPPRSLAPVPRRGAWPPPAPPATALDTASFAALQLSQRWPAPSAPRLQLILPTQRHTMEGASHTPDDGSDGNDPVSAPSEFLAEFLSAIMQRQYAEALKYCRLILQYEPHNATARGFYSLLQHKVATAPAAAPPEHTSPPSPPSPPGPHSEPACCGSSSADSSPRHAAPCRLRRLADNVRCTSHEEMQQEEDSSASSSSPGSAARVRSHSRSASGSESDDSCASQSSLELDSSPSLSLSRRTDHTESVSGSGAGWESSGTPPSSGSLAAGDALAPDDNGNAPATPDPKMSLQADDMQNDNDHTVPIKSESSSESLRRLRAQFTCSIK